MTACKSLLDIYMPCKLLQRNEDIYCTHCFPRNLLKVEVLNEVQTCVIVIANTPIKVYCVDHTKLLMLRIELIEHFDCKSKERDRYDNNST